MAGNVILCGYLGICSFHDCRTGTVPVRLLYLGFFIGGIYAGIGLCAGWFSWKWILPAVLPGIMMVAYGRLTGGKLGEADGMMVIPAGLLQGWERCTAEVITACFLTCLYAMLLLLTGKGTRHTRIPFAPFLLAAMLLLWTAGSAWTGLSPDLYAR